MKKIILCVCLMAVMSSAFSQLYVRANVGYNLPLSSEIIGTDYRHFYTDAGYIEKFEGVYGSYGSGFSAQVALGGAIGNGMLGYDLAFSYVSGKKYNVNSHFESYDGLYISNDKSSRYSRSIQFSPAVTFTMGTGKVQPVARFGPVVAITKLNQEDDQYDTYSDMRYHYKYKFTGGISAGFRGSVGINYEVTERVKLSAEVLFTGMAYSPTKREMEEFTINGEDRLQDVPKEQRVVELEKEYKTENQEGDPPMRQPYSMSSWGIQVGAMFAIKK